MKKTPIVKKIVPFLSLFLFIITCSIIGTYYYLYYSTIPRYEQKLHHMAITRSEEINIFLNKQEQNAITLTQEAVIINSLKTTKNDSPQDQSIIALLNTHKTTMGFKNILLINATGTIVLSTTKNEAVGKNVNQHPHSSLNQSYERASMSLTNDFSSFNYNELLNEPALFITIPMLDDKKFIGTLAYQLDQNKIYLIAHQYIGLEKTGEVVLAYKDKDYLVFAAPTRHDQDLAFKKRLLSTDNPIALQKAVLGQEGYGTGINYQGNSIIGAWQFIPRLDWGMIIEINHNEVIAHTHTIYNLLLICLILLVISLLLTIFMCWRSIKHSLHRINHTYPYNKIPSFIKNPLFILFLIFLGFSVKNIIFCKHETLLMVKNAQNKAIHTTTENAENIDAFLKKITFVGQSIAQDLHSNYLAQDDIITRIKRDIKENNMITEILIARSLNSTEKSQLYSTRENSQTSAENVLKTSWYTQAIEKGTVWIINNQQDGSAQLTATYACAFSNKNNEPQGVIAITCMLQPITEIADNSGIGQTGYSFIMTENGRFIYHPINSLVQTNATLLQYAQSKGNEELASIAEKIISQPSLMASYSAESSQERMWIYTHPIPVNKWIIGTIFSEDEIDLPAETVRHYYFWILIWLGITILLLLALLCQQTIISLMYYAIIANSIIIAALLISWYIIKITTNINRESRIIITDQSALNKFLNDLNEEAKRKHETAPISIPSGIILYSLTNSGFDTITVSGYLWNKYNSKLPSDIIRGMDLPQATRMVYGTPLISKSDGEETSTWNIQGTMYQEQKYEKFPFDQQQIRIMLEHKDIEKNIILTPDLTAYKKISPETTPGLDKDFSLSGFTIEQTFFEYQKVDPNANFGFKEYGKVTDNYHLIYNIIINRNLINPFVIYLLPLLVILFTLFTTLLIIKKNTSPFSILGGYSGLFFALIVLQRSLREQYPSGSTLYMEYAFFYTYITIILLMVHTLIMHYYKEWEFFQHKSLYGMKILFWPFQFIMWLITTLIIFY